MTVHNTQDPERQWGRSLTASISNAIVALVREYTGRGPTKAHTTIRDNTVLVILKDTLTKGERTLVASGRAEKVLDLRFEFQGAMSAEACARVEGITGRRVVAMMSTNHIDPDLAAEIFVLDEPPAPQPSARDAAIPDEATSDPAASGSNGNRRLPAERDVGS